MHWKSFHHPDWNLPAVKRRIREEWIDLMKDVGDLLAVRGRFLDWHHSYSSQTAYRSAMTRLRKAGLAVHADPTGNLPHLRLTKAAIDSLPIYHAPEPLWETPWNGIWYMLIFDVPETERHYRDTLRGFLKRLRMGCLQKSVWITPRDIRPEYSDLQKAADIGAISYLLESRAVLHEDTIEIVENAWDFSHLHELQMQYLNVFQDNLRRLCSLDQNRESVLQLLYLEAEAYIQCMRRDPLLPHKLLPVTYLGRKVYELHGKLRKQIAQSLCDCI